MKYEYKTTCGDLSYNEYEPDDPKEPEGKGWELIGFAASSHKLYWSWRRLVMEKV